jgi:hypothetical protein
MADEAFGSTDMTGRWTGFYRYRSEALGVWPIVAEIRQEGSRVFGEMYDQVTDYSESLENILETRRDQLSVLQRWKIEQTLTLIGARSMVVSFRLPDTSDIEGTVRGVQVKFTKRYRGTVVHKSTVEGKDVGLREKTDHRVKYSGQLDPVQWMISGRWLIGRRGMFGWLLPPSGWGTFELYKKS